MALEMTLNFGDTTVAPQRNSLPLPSGPPAPKRHCWECLRRRLVCDSAQPVCRKCHDAGVVCPGYDDKKPLKWVTTGRISSRPRQQRKSTSAAAGGPTSTTTKATKASNTKYNKKKEAASQKQIVTVVPIESQSPDDFGCLGVLAQNYLRTDACDMVQAAHYCKSTSPPETLPIAVTKRATGSRRKPSHQ